MLRRKSTTRSLRVRRGGGAYDDDCEGDRGGPAGAVGRGGSGGCPRPRRARGSRGRRPPGGAGSGPQTGSMPCVPGCPRRLAATRVACAGRATACAVTRTAPTRETTRPGVPTSSGHSACTATRLMPASSRRAACLNSACEAAHGAQCPGRTRRRRRRPQLRAAHGRRAARCYRPRRRRQGPPHRGRRHRRDLRDHDRYRPRAPRRPARGQPRLDGRDGPADPSRRSSARLACHGSSPTPTGWCRCNTVGPSGSPPPTSVVSCDCVTADAGGPPATPIGAAPGRHARPARPLATPAAPTRQPRAPRAVGAQRATAFGL